jgi:hypothetical protein
VWHAFFAPRILQLREMSIDDIRQVPAVGEAPTGIDPGEIFLPVLGLGLTAFILAFLLLGSIRRFRS